MIDFCDLELLAVTEPFLETSFTVLMWIPYHALTFELYTRENGLSHELCCAGGAVLGPFFDLKNVKLR